MLLVKYTGIGMMALYNIFFIGYCAGILKPRIPKLLLYSAVPLAVTVSIALLLQFNILIPILYMLNFVIYYVALRFCFHGKSAHIFWAVVNVMFHLIAVRAVTIGIMSLAFNLNMFRIISNEALYFLSLTISLMIMSAFLFIFNKLIDAQSMKQLLANHGQFQFVALTETVLLGFMFFCTYSYYYNLDLVWFTIFHILTAVFSMLCFYVVLTMAIKTSKWIAEDLNGEHMRVFMEKQGRHRRTILQLSDELGRPALRYSDNEEVDTVLWALAEDCKQSGICLSVQCNIGGGCSLTPLQLWILLVQLCDNALEACSRQQDSERWIDILCENQEGNLVITIKNSFDGVICTSDNELVSTKQSKDFHGLGIRSVEALAKMAGGRRELSIDRKQREFLIRIILPCTKEQEGKR